MLHFYKNNDYTFFFVLIIITIIYFPIYSYDFAQADDYAYFLYEDRSSFKYHPQFNFFILVGRPIYNFIMSPFSFFIENLQSFKILRISSLLLVFIICFQIYSFSKYLNFSKLYSFSFSLIIALIPGIQIGLIWITLLPFFFSIILTFYGGCYFVKKCLIENLFTFKKWIKLALIFLISIFLYQPWAMFIVIPLIMFILSERCDKSLRQKKQLILFIIFILSLILFHFVFQKLLLNFVYLNIDSFKNTYMHLGNFKFETHSSIYSLISDIFTKFSSNIHRFFVPIASIESVQNKIPIMFILPFYFTIFFIILKSRGFGLMSIIITLIIISIFPAIFAKGGHVGYRVVLPFSSILVLLVIFTLKTCGEHTSLFNYVTKSSLITILITIGIFSYKNIYYSVLNNVLEIAVFDKLIKSIDINNVDHIHIKPIPNGNVSFLGYKTTGNGEFFHNSSVDPNNSALIIKAVLGFWTDHTIKKNIVATNNCNEIIKNQLIITHDFNDIQNCEKKADAVFDLKKYMEK